MHPYIIESMARVGCGVGDTQEIAKIASELSHIEWDTLDAMQAFGANCILTEVGNNTRTALNDKFSEDDLICLAMYVASYRNVNSKYPKKAK